MPMQYLVYVCLPAVQHLVCVCYHMPDHLSAMFGLGLLHVNM